MTRVKVTAGICGFSATVSAIKIDKMQVAVQIDSDCDKITDLGKELLTVELRDLFNRPFNRGKVFEKAAQSNLHSTCPVPCAVLKAVEVELELALKEDVHIVFS